MFVKRPTIELELVRELLRRGSERLRTPGAWLQGGQSVTAAGEDTKPEAQNAAQWCCLGAVRSAAAQMCGGKFEGTARQLYEAATFRMARALIEHLDCRRVSRDPATAPLSANVTETVTPS